LAFAGPGNGGVRLGTGLIRTSGDENFAKGDGAFPGCTSGICTRKSIFFLHAGHLNLLNVLSSSSSDRLARQCGQLIFGGNSSTMNLGMQTFSSG